MATPTRTYILSLYRGLLRNGSKFASYNFRDYAVRRTKDGFRAHVNETDPTKIQVFVRKAEENLDIVKRQAAISRLYTKNERLVIEKPSKAH